MDELIERIEDQAKEIQELKMQLEAEQEKNEQLNQQNAELLELEGKEKDLQNELNAQKILNEKFKDELAAMQEQYAERLKDLERISLAAATVSPSAIEGLGQNVTALQNAVAEIQMAAERVKKHAWRYFSFYCFLVACAIGIGGVGLYNLSKIARNVNDILYLVLPK